MAHSTDIVAYTYEADIYCPSCMHLGFTREALAAGRASEFEGFSTEQVLDWCANELAIDRYDEYSFDSSEFPKVVFRDAIDHNEHCGGCHTTLA